MIKEGQRKVRSDAKKDIKPNVPVELKDAVYRMSYITTTAVMHVAERFVMHAIKDSAIQSKVGQYFQRDVYIDGTFYCGSIKNPGIPKISGEAERIHLRLSKPAYEILSVYAYALNCSHSRACAILLEESVLDLQFINNYVKEYLEGTVDKARMRELRTFMNYVDKDNTEHSWAAMLSYITDEIKKPMANAQEVVSEFFINHWRDND